MYKLEMYKLEMYKNYVIMSFISFVQNGKFWTKIIM